MKHSFGLLALSLPLVAAAAGEGVFDLGTVVVTAARPQVGEVATAQVSSVVSRDEIRQFERTTVSEAINLLSGVTVTNNSRNEQTVYLRGYDPRQAPLFIDGIPVYVPYDGYVDFGRFGTGDLAAIQVAKGFSSVAYGPNTLGGAINLISRKPTRVFEGDVNVGFSQENTRRADVNVGTNQGLWYLQASAGYREADGFRMSSDFKATPTENGGRRNNSYYKDDKGSLKIGLTPNKTDEYALTYLKQNGEKGQPPLTTDSVAGARYWQWPMWDKESLYFVSRTQLGAHETLKLRLYTDKFDNEVNSFTDASYAKYKISGPASFTTGRSIYHDKTYGGSVELESRRFKNNILRAVAHYKNDKHEEKDGNSFKYSDFEDTLKSFALEDTLLIGDRTQLMLGVSRHTLDPEKVFKSGSGTVYTLPGKQHATDPQIGLFHDFSPTVRLYATIADKTRLPSLKDRYSARLGNYVENPKLAAEEARNYEIGYQGQPWAGAQAEIAVFRNDIEDKIQAVNLKGAASCSAKTPCQMQNVGEARIKGVELSLKTPLGKSWEVGGNATFMSLKNTSDSSVKLTDIPNRKIVLHTLWRPADNFDLIALAEHDGKRWASNTVRLGGFTIFNLKGVMRVAKDFSAEVGVNNATDKNYEAGYGIPAAGRMWFANLNYRF